MQLNIGTVSTTQPITLNEFTAETTWAANRIANRYQPLISNPSLAGLTTNKRVEVIVMDTGVNKNHQEFDGVAVEDLYFTPRFGSTNDDLGHGTMMASIIAGKVNGVNPSAVLKIVKIFGAGESQVPEGEIAAAFEEILAHHAASPDVFKIVNMAWEIPYNSLVNAKLQQLLDAGVMLVASAGKGENIDTITPAGYPGVFTVAASSKDDCEVFDFHGVNKKLDMYAPGQDVIAASAIQNDGFSLATGSSPAAAMVSGVASLVAGLFDTEPTVDDVKDALLKDATSSALLVNSMVSSEENRLLHRPDSLDMPKNQDYYAGNISLQSGNGIKLSLKSILNLQAFEDNFASLKYNIVWGKSEFEQAVGSYVSIDANADINMSPIDVMDFGTDELIKQFYFSVECKNQNITIVSPTIHFFVTAEDTSGVDVSASLETLRSQVTLVPFETLLHDMLK